jgi:hypothetical protein
VVVQALLPGANAFFECIFEDEPWLRLWAFQLVALHQERQRTYGGVVAPLKRVRGELTDAGPDMVCQNSLASWWE